MLDPELAEERQDEIVDAHARADRERRRHVESHEPWGRRKLAYEIDHKADGVYHLLRSRASRRRSTR